MEENKNSFKEIEEEALEESSFPEEEILQDVESEISGFRFVGGTFDIFFKIFDVIISLLGGKSDDKNNKS